MDFFPDFEVRQILSPSDKKKKTTVIISYDPPHAPGRVIVQGLHRSASASAAASAAGCGGEFWRRAVC